MFGFALLLFSSSYAKDRADLRQCLYEGSRAFVLQNQLAPQASSEEISGWLRGIDDSPKKTIEVLQHLNLDSEKFARFGWYRDRLALDCQAAASGSYYFTQPGSFSFNSTPFYIEFLQRCSASTVLKNHTNCLALARDVTSISDIRRMGPADFGSYTGGQGHVEDFLLRHPETDPMIKRFLSYIGSNAQALNQDPWTALLMSQGLQPQAHLTPDQSELYLRVLGLFVDVKYSVPNFGVRLLAQRQHDRYAQLAEELFEPLADGGPGTLLPREAFMYTQHPTVFGLQLPDPERSYHAVSGANAGCTLRKLGYSADVIADAEQLVGLIYKNFAYQFVPRASGRSDWDRDKHTPPGITIESGFFDLRRADWLIKHASPMARKALKLGLNGALNHRLGAQFGAALCAPAQPRR
ncbi:MAG: hypothetical protein V1798_09220 [Pseudomonadota bacterium]